MPGTSTEKLRPELTPSKRESLRVSSLCSRITFLPHQTLTQKEEEPPSLQQKNPSARPAQPGTYNSCYVACMLKQGRKGIYTSTWQSGINLGKAVAISPPRSLHLPERSSLPVFYNVNVTCAKKNHHPQSAIKQVTMQATCTGTPQVVNIFPTVPVGVYSVWCHAVNNETSPQLRE